MGPHRNGDAERVGSAALAGSQALDRGEAAEAARRTGAAIATPRPIPAFRTKILTGLLSSWIASPLAMGFAQVAGFANAPSVLVAVLTLGAIAPLMVLVNEALAPAVVVRGRGLTRAISIPLAALQCATIASIFLYPGTPRIRPAEILVAVGAGIASSHFSGIAAMMQLRAIYAGTLRHRTIALVASTPGLLMLAVFVAVGALRHAGIQRADWLVYLAVALPSPAQCLLLRLAARTAAPDGRAPPLPRATTAAFFGAGILFLAAASAATALKGDIAAHHARFAGLLLVALNSTFSISFTFGKILFLEGARSMRGRLWTTLFALAAATAAALALEQGRLLGLGAALALLVVVQGLMTVTISVVRGIVHAA